MDQFKKFLMAMPIPDREDFAKRCGTSYAFLRNIAYGTRIPGEKLCVAIWRESGGVVNRQMLRPDDWQDIWPELVQQN